MKFFKYILLALLVVFPIAVFAYGKPLKVAMPEIAGVECLDEGVCLDDASRIDEARALYDAAIVDVEKRLSPYESKPKIVFCSTAECFAAFGFTKQAGVSIGSLGVVISPRGWKPHYVSHELIHQWQAEKFGFLNVWLAENWIIEGMAYSVSNDPREQLSEPFQSYRERYNRTFSSLEGAVLVDALGRRI